MRHTVLIIDDAEFMRAMLREIVEDMGCQVVGEAGDGRRAAELYRELEPDLVLLDITMPEVDGTEALREILEVDPEASVVMISALGQKAQVLKAIKAGAQDFVVKPMNCPCHVQIYNAGLHSYRDLPIRMAEFGSCHRYEAHGALHGLMRVRHFTQDDAHIFITEDQLMEECLAIKPDLVFIWDEAWFGFARFGSTYP